MTASEILNIAVTVGVIQLLCDIVSNYIVYKGENYQRCLASLERTKWKYDKAKQDSTKNPEKQTNIKRLQRAKDEYGEVISEVARKHTGPGIMTSIMFVLLLRILGTEHSGKIIAFVPFVPFNFVSNKIITRGVDVNDITKVLNNNPYILLNDGSGEDGASTASTAGGAVHVKQITTFLFIYLLSTFSIKYYVNKLFGTKPPTGADNGLMSIMESPKSQRMLKSMGIDPDEYKMQ